MPTATQKRALPITRKIVDQWLKDNTQDLETYEKGAVKGYYRTSLGPAASLKSRSNDGTPFKTWRDVFEYLTFES